MNEKEGLHLNSKAAEADYVEGVRSEGGTPGMPDVADEPSGGVVG